MISIERTTGYLQVIEPSSASSRLISRSFRPVYRRRCATIEDDRTPQIVYTVAMAEKPKPDLNADLHRTLNNACRKWGAREIRLRYLPKPSINRWIAEALIDHHRVIEKIRADIPAGELTLQDMESFNDQPIARGMGDTATDAIKTMSPLQWRAPRNG
jgi:hypothetical protein